MGDQPENFGTPAAIASSTLGVPTAIDRGTLQTELDKLRFREKTAPALPPIQGTLEDGTSTFNKNERSTITALDALGELDRAAHCLDELADALACSSSPQWDAARCRHIGGRREYLVLLRRHRRCQRGEANLFRLPDGRSLRPGCS